MTDPKYYSFKDGLPVGPDVAAIRKQWPNLKIGDRVPYEDMEALLGLEKTTNRFGTVTDAWRKAELERGLVIICERSRAFVVATAEQITGSTSDVLGHVVRTAKKHRRRLATIQPADDLQRQVVEHQGRLMSIMEREGKKSRMNVFPSMSVQQPPKRIANDAPRRPAMASSQDLLDAIAKASAQ